MRSWEHWGHTPSDLQLGEASGRTQVFASCKAVGCMIREPTSRGLPGVLSQDCSPRSALPGVLLMGALVPDIPVVPACLECF